MSADGPGSFEVPSSEPVDPRVDQREAEHREDLREALGEAPRTAEEEQSELVAEGRLHQAEDHVEKGDIKEALRSVDPNASEEKNEVWGEVLGEIKKSVEEHTALDDTARSSLINRFERIGTTQEEAKTLVEGMGLPEEEELKWFEEIDKKLKPMDEKEKEEVVPDSEVEELNSAGRVLAGEIERREDELNQVLTDPNAPEEDKERARQLKGRVSTLYDKVTGIFQKGETGKIVLRRSGKTLYYICLALFIAVVFEMHMLHHVSKTK